MLGLMSYPRKVFQFPGHQKPRCPPFQETRNSHRRGMGTMDHAKSIVDVLLNPASQLAGKLGVVCRFSFLGSQVFHQQQLAGLEPLDLGLNLRSDAVVDESHLGVQQ